MKNLKSFYTLALGCLGMMMMVACEKDEATPSTIPASTPSQQPGFFEMAGGGNNGQGGEVQVIEMDEMDCFEFNYPIDIQLTGDQLQTINSNGEFENAIENWMESNPNANEFPTIAFPISVNVDGENITINNENALTELMIECFEGDWDEDDFDIEDCFTFHFPVDVLLPNGQTSTANDFDELENIFDNWYDNNEDHEQEPEMVYPFTVTVEETGEDVIISNEDEFDEMLEVCDC